MPSLLARHLRPVATALLVGVAGCSGGPPPPSDGLVGGAGSSGDGTDTGLEDGSTDEGSTGEAEPADPCAEACRDLADQSGIAMCHACRCKDAFDGWLPSVDELQCGHGEAIVTYHAELLDDGYELRPTGPSATRCANPSLLTGSCRQGSRLGHLTHGDVSVYWVCRDPYLDYDGSVIYEDMAVIGHNARTGATCFWDDINDVMHDDDAPPLDLLDASEAERARSIERFAYNDGSGCISCHDHDPFVYTPYLQSTSWTSIAADKGPYHLVELGGTPRATGVMELVSPQAAPCTSCHRIGSVGTCSLFAPDSLAAHKLDAYEPAVLEASDPSSPSWRLAHWMPDASQSFVDYAQWEASFAEARDHVLRCCESPGVDADGCRWAPISAH